MKNLNLKILASVYLFLLFLISNLFILNGAASPEIIDPKLGNAPIVDGTINNSINEWNAATKKNTFLFPVESQNGLSIKLWALQNSSFLYISIQFDLEEHNSSEFVGILISQEVGTTSEDLDDSDFFDAKIIQFKNISQNNFEYMDFYINNTKFYNDTVISGDGAANIIKKSAVYEFSIPIVNPEAAEDIEDVFLEIGKMYAFKFVYGTSDTLSHPDGIKLSNYVLINIKYEPPTPVPIDIDLVLLILTIVIFSIIGALYIFYLYEIVVLKKKVRRIRR